MARHYWSKQEENYILSLIGRYPLQEIANRVRKKFNVQTTDRAIVSKAGHLAIQHQEKVCDRIDNYSMRSLSIHLGIDNTIVLRWLKNGLRATKCGKLWMIKLKDVVAYAKQYPRKFKQIPRLNLEWLLSEHPDVLKLVEEAKPLRPCRAFICVTTGKRYSSINRAYAELQMSRGKLKNHLDLGLPAKVGDKYLKFQWVD